MTSHLQMSTCKSALSTSPSTLTKPQAVREAGSSSPNKTKLIESMKSIYQADQQVQFLHLQAEVETLLLQLQVLKQQREDVRPSADRYAVDRSSRQLVAAGVSQGSVGNNLASSSR